VVTLYQPFFIAQPRIGGVEMYSNTLYLNANGFSTYNGVGALQADKLSQEAIWDTYAKMYRYYFVEEIELHYVPTRMQYGIGGAGPIGNEVTVW
jgi:hypothetical protein